MARKRRNRGNKPPNPQPTEGPMRQFMHSLHGETGPETPQEKAIQIVIAAYQEPDEDCRVRLAREALAICPSCVDGYILLAEAARTHKETLALYQKAVTAGLGAFHPDAFRQAVGRFWSIREA